MILRVAFAALLASVAVANANIITYTASGVIAASSGTAISGETYGIDGGGYFGGGSIVGAPYAVTWTATDCECTGTPNFGPLANHYPNPNPILDVTLTINGRSYDFGGNGWYGEFYLNNDLNLQQTGYLDGSFISTSIGFAATSGSQGEFQIINPDHHSTLWMTSGQFQESPDIASVPGPIAGSGIIGLIFGGLFCWWRRKRNKS